MLLCTEGAFCVSIYCNDATWTGHLELEISVMWHRVESSKCGSSEQGVIAAAKWDDIEDYSFASEVIRGTEDHLQRD